MSNALLVAGAHTATGNPIAVFGPQTGLLHAAAPGREGRARPRHRRARRRVRRHRHSTCSSGAARTTPGRRRRRAPTTSTSSCCSSASRAAGRRRSPRWATCTTASASRSRRTSTRRRRRRRSRGASSAPSDYGPLSERGTLADGTPIAIAPAVDLPDGARLGARLLSRQRPGVDDERLRRLPGDWAAASTTPSTGSTSTAPTSGTSTRASARSARRASIRTCRRGATGRGTGRASSRSPRSRRRSNPPQGYLTSWNNKQAPEFMANDRAFSLRAGLSRPDAQHAHRGGDRRRARSTAPTGRRDGGRRHGRPARPGGPAAAARR